MTLNLLDKTRKISQMMQQTVKSDVINFDEVTKVLCGVIKANIYIVNNEGLHGQKSNKTISFPSQSIS